MNADKKSPRVSIVLPVFNGERYLRRAIESILDQTYADFELLICDNASTDTTEE
ncbi:MAG: glycosyltransferase family 2 protein, partial [Pseudomonadales bacterium]